jgi:DNA-binding MarR family transcriptional regulator
VTCRSCSGRVDSVAKLISFGLSLGKDQFSMRETMRKRVQTEEYLQLWALLHLVRDAIAKSHQNELRKTGVSMAQAGVLHFVKSTEGPVTPADISRCLFREQNTVFTLVKQMEKKGLLTKTKDLERKNMVRIVLTEKGEEAHRRAMEKRQVIADIMSCLSPKEYDNLWAYMDKLRDSAFAKLSEAVQITPPIGPWFPASHS